MCPTGRRRWARNTRASAARRRAATGRTSATSGSNATPLVRSSRGRETVAHQPVPSTAAPERSPAATLPSRASPVTLGCFSAVRASVHSVGQRLQPTGVALLERLEQVHGDVADADLVVFLARGLGAVVDHDVAERARSRDAARPGGDELLAALVVDLLAGGLLHPHASAAGAAAHALGAVAAGLDDLDAAEAADHLAGRQVHVVVAAEVAGVVVDDPLVEPGVAHVEPALGNEPLEQLAVVDDLVVAAELRVLVAERVEAVGALGDDLAHAHAVERLDVLHGEHLEDVLVARAPCGVAGAVLGRAEDGEVEPGPLHQLGHGDRDLLVLVVEAAGAAHPVEVLVVERAAGLHDRHAVELGGPGAPVALRHAPGVARVLHRPVRRAQLGGEVGLHEREVAPHVEDLVEDLDVDRADLVARLARRAG